MEAWISLSGKGLVPDRGPVSLVSARRPPDSLKIRRACWGKPFSPALRCHQKRLSMTNLHEFYSS
jgi:hypothetical protein